MPNQYETSFSGFMRDEEQENAVEENVENAAQPVEQEAYYNPNNKPQKPQKNGGNNGGKKGFKVFISILLALVIFVVGASVGRLSGVDIGDNKPSVLENDDTLKYQGDDVDVKEGVVVEREDVKPDENGKYTASQVAQIVSESVVNIQVYSKTDSSAGATASGVILDEKGYIITNDHIYSEVVNAKFIITTSSGESYKASYIAGDQRSDIAVLKFDETPKGIVPAVFDTAAQTKAGDDVIAIGSPYGLSGTVTKGIVSYPSRRISTSTKDANGQTTSSYSMRVVQTDVALNSGNSGGALVNMYGQVVGINSSKIAIAGYEGLCFAIPSKDAVKYAKSLIKYGVVANRARLGITYNSVTTAAAILNDIPAGLLIQEIDKESELATKNITVGKNGDIITEMNGKKLISSDIALDIIDDSNAGDEVSLKIYQRATKSYKTYKIKLLEYKSNTSYVNEIPKPTTSKNNNSDGYEFYQSPFEFGQ
ncbi:MAG: serine protease [Clostridia bacterium]|nr:serine protease [Clostridia bacterium]